MGWCYVCDREGVKLAESWSDGDLSHTICNLCRDLGLREGSRPVRERSLSLATRRILDALDVNP